MTSIRNHYYNPFSSSFLGVFVPNSSYAANDSYISLEDIDLNYQPVPPPFASGIHAVLSVITLILGSYLHIRVLFCLRKDDSILKGITQVFVVTNLTLHILAISTSCITNIVHTFPSIAVNYICPIIWFLIYQCINLITFYSFICALMRYVFIVHTEKVNSYGKEKVKTIFFVLSILIPLILTIWKASDSGHLDALSYINRCYGRHHDSFLVETSRMNVLKKSFCQVPNYAELKGYDKLIAMGKQILCVASTIIMIIMGSNLAEGFIYYKLFSFMNK